MAYDPEYFVRMMHAGLGIPYNPVWPDAEACLYWWQWPVREWLVDRCE